MTGHSALSTRPSQLPRGYKQTEVGVIPEDWEVKQLSHLIEHDPKNGYSGRSAKDARGTLTLSLAATTSGQMILNSETIKTLETHIPITSPLYLEEGDVLVQRSNTPDLVGMTAIFNGPSSTYIYPDLMMRLGFKEQITGEWFWRIANSSQGRRYFVGVAAGSTGTMPKISGRSLSSMPIPLPPTLAEQEAIAKALSDADALIESLEQLIAKKRLIKQGAMQELLTGKKRLPGFSGEWEVKRLGEVGVFLKGSGITREQAQSGHLPCVRYGELYTTHDDIIREFKSFISPSVAATATPIKQGDILFAGSGETKEEIGKCAAFVHNCEAYAGGDVVILRPSNVDSEFMGYALNALPIRRQRTGRGQGDAVVHISANALRQIEINLPPSIDEQTAIATILSDMDAEIVALEERLEKARQIKQGMMQELLTGRVRLVGKS